MQAFASIGSISHSGRQRASSSRAIPKTSPPTSGTEIAKAGVSSRRPDSRTPGSKLEENTMQQIDTGTHGGDDQASGRSNQRSQHDKRLLLREPARTPATVAVFPID